MSSAAPAGRRRAPRVPGAALAAGLLIALLGACSGSSAQTGKADPSSGATTGPVVTTAPSGTPTAAGTVALSPLTGLPAASPEAAARPIVAVAVATGAGRPAPVGLERADLSYVSFPVSGRQRTVALFQSQDADRVGPVDATRPVDNKLVVVVGGVLEHAGGSEQFVSRTDSADVPQWSAVVHPSSFTRDAAGLLYGSTAAARAEPGTKPAVLGLVAFRSGPDPAVPPPVPVGVSVPGQPSLGLSYDAVSRTWRGALGSLPVQATNVIIQQVAYQTLNLQKSDATEQDPEVFGTGTALVLSGERLIDVNWNRAGRAALTGYVGTDGIPVRLAVGTTVVLLVPAGTPVTH